MLEKYIETDNGKVVYWTNDTWKPERKTLFFFHGLTGDHTMFDGQYCFFQDKFNLILWDAPGHGKSRPYVHFSMDAGVKAILEILRQEKVKSFIAVGQSYGGYFPQAIACRKPGVVEGLIGIGTTPYGEDYYTDMDYFWMRQLGWMSQCFPWGPFRKVVGICAAVTKHGYQNMLQMLSQFTHREYGQLLKVYYQAFIADNRELEITFPVLITRGLHDPIGKVRAYCLDWHEKTGFPLELIDRARHNANADNPEEVNGLIYGFIHNEILREEEPGLEQKINPQRNEMYPEFRTH